MKTTCVYAGLIAVLFGTTAMPSHAIGTSVAANAAQNAGLSDTQPLLSTQDLGQTDLDEMRVLVQSYLWAISNRQADLLFMTAAESVTSVYSTPDALLRRMAHIHRPVVGGSLVQFDGVSIYEGVPVQHVYIKDERGRQWLASYFLDRQSDGQWKIAGCVIVPAPGRII